VWRSRKEISKKITLGRLETSEDFRAQAKPKCSKMFLYHGLKFEARTLN
jgi:hypothetical protein